MSHLIFFLYNLEEILYRINNSFKMARRPSIQLNDLQNPSQKSIEETSSIFQLRPSTQNIKTSLKRRHTLANQSTSQIQDSCSIKNEEGYCQSEKQKMQAYLNVSKIDQLRYRIASAQKSKLQQNKKILKTVIIPLSLEKKPPMIRIHQQVLVKNCQKVQLQYKHYFNQVKKEKNEQMKVIVQRALTVCGSANNKDTQEGKNQDKVNHLNMNKNKRSYSQPQKIVQNELAEENQFLPNRKKTKKNMNFKIELKNKVFESKVKLKMIKFEPFVLRQRKNTLNGDTSQTQADNKQSRLLQQKQYNRKSNPLSNISNKHGLNLQLLQLYNKIKNSPSKTPNYQMALFKNKLQGKGNHRLIL